MQQLTIEMLNLENLVPFKRNARTHSKKQIRQIADSIKEFGFTNPILIDADNVILAGHGRLAEAKHLDMQSVPCVRLEHMSATQKRAYVLADNKIALNAGWDEDILAEELQDLISIDADFNVELTGFSIPEIDTIFDLVALEEPDDPADEILPDADANLPECRLGDIWQLGPHRLVCGDALDKDVVNRLMDAELARMVFADPPYNVAINGNVCGKGTQHAEFAMASGEMSKAEFTAFLTTACENLAAHSHEGSIHFICMDWRHISEMMSAGLSVYSELKNMIVWVKDNGGWGHSTVPATN